MKTSRQLYVDSHRDQALQNGCDSFQLKYDGWWCQMISVNGNFTLASQEARVFRSGNMPSGLNAIIIGEFMQGTQWSQQEVHKDNFYVFDIWELDGLDLTGMPYRDRYSLLQTLKPDLSPWCKMVANYPMTSFEIIWAQEVESGKFEGVVFRNRSAPVAGPLLRVKRDIEETFTCVGFVEGEGRNLGRLGALQIDKKTDSGEIATVGGGFSDQEREYIWLNQHLFLNRKFDAVGKARFTSGLLRHPNFVRWKSPATILDSTFPPS